MNLNLLDVGISKDGRRSSGAAAAVRALRSNAQIDIVIDLSTSVKP